MTTFYGPPSLPKLLSKEELLAALEGIKPDKMRTEFSASFLESIDLLTERGDEVNANALKGALGKAIEIWQKQDSEQA